MRLVEATAAGNHQALRALYERTHRIVFTLVMRICRRREMAEEITVDVFHDVWRRSREYDPRGGSVVGWIMMQARSRAIDRLPASERSAFEVHVDGCPACRQELDALRPIVDAFVDWPTDILRSPTSLWERLATRIAVDTGGESSAQLAGRWIDEPEWKEVAPGISCKLLATDTANERVSMLVRLAPGVVYPPHYHAGVEELHLLDGELWIEDRKLYPGDYNRGEPGTGDSRVWSETGCTCVLVTSFSDILR